MCTWNERQRKEPGHRKDKKRKIMKNRKIQVEDKNENTEMPRTGKG